jgi:hypothetical protein
MTLTFKSSTPETFVLAGWDAHGRQRRVTATRGERDFNWQLRLQHPSGENWPATYHGESILNAMSELMRSKDSEFKQAKARGDRPPPKPRDYNQPVDSTPAPISAFAWRTR